MKSSIIIPTLNEENKISACLLALQPLKQQSEVIVVDGGSTDKTRELAAPLADLVLVSAPGRAKQMNAGADKANGNTLIFLHADTFLPDQALSLIERTDLGWGRFDIQLNGKLTMLKVISFFMNWRSRLTGIATGDQVIFVRKHLFDRVGGYPDIALMEDITLCSNLKKHSKPDCLSAKVKSSGRRWEQYGVFKTILLMWSLRLRYFFGVSPEILSTLYRRGLFWKL